MACGPSTPASKGLANLFVITGAITIAQVVAYLLLSEVLPSVMLLQPEVVQRDALLATVVAPLLCGVLYAAWARRSVDTQQVFVGVGNTLIACYLCAAAIHWHTALGTAAFVVGVASLVISIFLESDPA